MEPLVLSNTVRLDIFEEDPVTLLKLAGCQNGGEVKSCSPLLELLIQDEADKAHKAGL